MPARPATRRATGPVVVLSAAVALIVGAAAGVGSSLLTQQVLVPAPQEQATTAPADPGSASSQPSAPPVDRPGDTVSVSRSVLPSTVTITVRGASGESSGSGFVLDDSGHILTNNHVVEAADTSSGRIRVSFPDGHTVDASIVGRSPSYDLAVIIVTGVDNLTPARLGDSDTIRVGERAIAFGSPLGLSASVTEGIISATDRPVVVTGENRGGAEAATAYINGIQTDAAINPGNSGGPLVDAEGRVIGVNSAILTMSRTSGSGGSIGLGFAIPINQATVVADALIADGEVQYPVIGAEVRDSQNADGADVSKVNAGGAADKAGLRAGDLVTAVGDRKVDSATELIVALRIHRPGETVELTLERGGREQQLTVTLDGRVG